MSSAPITPPPALDEAPAPRKPFSVVSAATGAATTIAARTFGLGALGFVLGIVIFFVERGTGLLAYPSETWSKASFLLLPLYMAAGAFGLGLAGMWRGIGRSAMNLVKEHKLSQHIAHRVLDRVAQLAAGSATPEIFHKPLPIESLRKLLGQASAAYAASDDTEKGLKGMSRAIVRRLKVWISALVESRLNDIIGEQAKNRSTVELTIDRLRELAASQLDGRVVAALDGARNKQALLFGALFVGTVTLPPLVLTFLR